MKEWDLKDEFENKEVISVKRVHINNSSDLIASGIFY